MSFTASNITPRSTAVTFGDHNSNEFDEKGIRPSPPQPILRASFKDWLILTKFHISAVSTSTAGMGYIAASGALRIGLLSTLLGTLLLAMSASTLNEVQERDIDVRMTRTRNRPIPSGRISVHLARWVALLLGTSGCGVLFFAHNVLTACLGLLALFWYNGLYTPLKRISAFAVVPGSVIGALPPAIGWCAAGGDPDSPALLALCFVFFVWQVPHFWLLALRHANDYERGGLPTLSTHFTPQQIQRLIFTWTSASVAACTLLGVFQATSSLLPLIAIGIGGLWLLVRFTFLLVDESALSRIGRAFGDINRFALIIMVAVICDALLRG